MTVYILIATCNLALWSNTLPMTGKEYALRQGTTLEEVTLEYSRMHSFCQIEPPKIFKYEDGNMTQIDFPLQTKP
jgi:hypothetical protein